MCRYHVLAVSILYSGILGKWVPEDPKDLSLKHWIWILDLDPFSNLGL